MAVLAEMMMEEESFSSHGVKSEVLRFLFVKFAPTDWEAAAMLVFNLNGIHLLLFYNNGLKHVLI